MKIEKYQMKYKIDKGKIDNNILKILDIEFVKNNRNKIKLIIENKKKELTDYIQLDNFKKSELKIIILFNKDISNLSYMFKNCEALIEFSTKDNKENNEINFDYDISETEQNFNELEDFMNNINENKGIIYDGLKVNINWYCSEIEKKEDNSRKTKISYLEIYNLQMNDDHFGEMIYKCQSSLSSPNISNWNTNNITNINSIFYNCKSLIFLPDILK